MSKRIEYIDIARGLGILLVVLGHNDFSLISPFLYQVIYSFHMPLFFFLSGYFINTSTTIWTYTLKRFHSLLKPYLFTIFIIYFVSISFGKMGFQTALGRIVKSLYGTGYYIDWVQLWFLPHLFAVSLYAYCFYVLFKALQNRIARWALLAGTLWLASLILKTFYPFSLGAYTLYGLPFSLDLVFLSGFFYILGCEVRQTVPDRFIQHPLLFFVTGAGVFLLNIFFTQRIDFNTRTYEAFPLNTLQALMGIFFVLALAYQIALRLPWLGKPLAYFGRVSLFILVFHVPIQDFWSQKVLAVTGNTPFSIWIGFIMGVGGSILLYELFIKANPVASWWFGRQTESPGQNISAK